jgi:MFS family permease
MVGRVTVVAVLGTTQTIAWASSYYMPAILGAPIADALHLPDSVFFGALLLSAIVGPSVGRLIDRHGGRALLAVSNLVIAAGLVILAAAQGIVALIIAWTVLGVGIGMGLYDAAFAALTWLYGREARSSITGITLIAGFASTIGWPLSALLLHELDWRAACLMWAGLNMLVAAPLNWLMIPRRGTPAPLTRAETESPPTRVPRSAMPILAFFFSATWFVQGAMAAHLPGLLQAAGASLTAAIAAAALVGPAQVGARIVEFGLLRSFHPIVSARIASARDDAHQPRRFRDRKRCPRNPAPSAAAFLLCRAGASAVRSGACARPVPGSSSPDACPINRGFLPINPVAV